ncbi:ComF family protein [Olivibacter sitiensis]|uniref:ComF family protein n=1 Tax=Olivibacter sitiensis TaxID=376470 RepID=UPI00041849B3|nr:double zinc ribbon domain-containing protein [Olivibacter sitiensis]
MRQVFHDFISLLFPPTCIGCGMPLYANEEYLCTFCWYKLPVTNCHLHPEQNEAAKHFWGRLQDVQAASYLYFNPKSSVERILYELKYNNKPEIGILLGKKYGEILQNTDFARIDAILPVPLHSKKKRKRGYNQSSCIAQGLAHAWNVPVMEDCLIRTKHTTSQTRKNRIERYENMKEAFTIPYPLQLEHKHVLLVDDVLTTGATIEACAAPLLKIEGLRLSILTLALAK